MATNSPTGMGRLPEGTTESESADPVPGYGARFSAALDGWVESREVASAHGDELIESGAMLPR